MVSEDWTNSIPGSSEDQHAGVLIGSDQILYPNVTLPNSAGFQIEERHFPRPNERCPADRCEGWQVTPPPEAVAAPPGADHPRVRRRQPSSGINVPERGSRVRFISNGCCSSVDRECGSHRGGCARSQGWSHSEGNPGSDEGSGEDGPRCQGSDFRPVIKRKAGAREAWETGRAKAIRVLNPPRLVLPARKCNLMKLRSRKKVTKRPRALEEDTGGVSEHPPDMNHGHDCPESDPTFEGKAIPTPQPEEAYVSCPDGRRILGISGWAETRPRREDPTAVRRTNESSVRLKALLWKQQPGEKQRNVVNAREKLRDTFDGLFWNKATNGGASYVALDDIMAHPEMRPFLVCDLLEEITSGPRDFYRVRGNMGVPQD